MLVYWFKIPAVGRSYLHFGVMVGLLPTHWLVTSLVGWLLPHVGHCFPAANDLVARWFRTLLGFVGPLMRGWLFHTCWLFVSSSRLWIGPEDSSVTQPVLFCFDFLFTHWPLLCARLVGWSGNRILSWLCVFCPFVHWSLFPASACSLMTTPGIDATRTVGCLFVGALLLIQHGGFFVHELVAGKPPGYCWVRLGAGNVLI